MAGTKPEGMSRKPSPQDPNISTLSGPTERVLRPIFLPLTADAVSFLRRVAP
jgi:hypothetical protein